jgi:hypothetical protein
VHRRCTGRWLLEGAVLCLGESAPALLKECLGEHGPGFGDVAFEEVRVSHRGDPLGRARRDLERDADAPPLLWADAERRFADGSCILSPRSASVRYVWSR